MIDQGQNQQKPISINLRTMTSGQPIPKQVIIRKKEKRPAQATTLPPSIYQSPVSIMSKHVIAVPATLTLQQKLDHFIDEVINKNREGQGPAFAHIMDELTERVISLFLLEPAHIAKFSPVMMKLVNFTASLASKTSSSLSGQLYKKASQQQIRAIAEFVQRVMWWEPSNDTHAFITVEVTDAFALQFRELVAECRAGRALQHRDEGARLCKEFADTIIDDLFLTPTKLLDLGMVMRKVLSVGVDGVKKALHEMINKVIKDVDQQQMLDFVVHYEQMIVSK